MTMDNHAAAEIPPPDDLWCPGGKHETVPNVEGEHAWIGVAEDTDDDREVVLFWECLKCWQIAHRWPKGHPLRKEAERYLKGLTAR